MVQEYLTAWINWFYGEDNYPRDVYDMLSEAERIEIIYKKRQIIEICGMPK